LAKVYERDDHELSGSQNVPQPSVLYLIVTARHEDFDFAAEVIVGLIDVVSEFLDVVIRHFRGLLRVIAFPFHLYVVSPEVDERDKTAKHLNSNDNIEHVLNVACDLCIRGRSPNQSRVHQQLL
jgi:hypothetical protein